MNYKYVNRIKHRYVGLYMRFALYYIVVESAIR